MLADKRGLVFIELLVVVAIVIVIFVAAAVNLSSFQDATSVAEYNTDLEEVQGLIAKAHAYARSGRLNDNWGILRLEAATSTCGSSTYVKCFVLFKGSDFTVRDKSYDEFVVYDDDLLPLESAGQQQAIYFQRNTGWGENFQNTSTTDATYFRFVTSDRSYDCSVHVGLLGVVYSDCNDNLSGSYTNSKKITIASDQVSGTKILRDYIFLFSEINDDFRTTGNGGFVQRSDGGDIIFTNADGSKQYDHEIDEYNASTGEVIAWIRIPRLDPTQDTVINMFYGNSGVNNQSTNTIWENHMGVYHFDDDPTGTIYDSTANGANGTGGSALTVGDSVTAKIGKGINTEIGSNEQISFTSFTSILDDYTISAWIKSSQADSTGKFILCNSNSSFCIAYMCNTSGQIGYYDGSGGSGGYDCFGDTPNDGDWHYLVFRFNSNESEATLFVDGTQLGSAGGYYDRAFDGTACYGYFGGGSCTYNTLDGVSDEFRVFQGWRSDDWLVTEYNNQNSTSTFYTLE